MNEWTQVPKELADALPDLIALAETVADYIGTPATTDMEASKWAYERMEAAFEKVSSLASGVQQQ